MVTLNTGEPAIAVIVPLYNTVRYIRECLESIQSQTWSHFICIIVNDGSTDGSREEAEKFACRDYRFIVINRTNGGVSAARNTALDYIDNHESNIRYICFVDSDDVVSPGFLEDFVTIMDRDGADLAECGVEIFSPDSRIAESQNGGTEVIGHAEIARHQYPATGEKDCTSFVGLCNKCYRTAVIGKIRFDENLICCEDQRFFFELYPRLNTESLIHKVSYFYRVRASSATGDDSRRYTRLQTALGVYHHVLNGEYEQVLKDAIAAMLFGFLYFEWRSLEKKGLPYARKIFDELRRHHKNYRNFCPHWLKRKIAVTGMGYRLSRTYLRLRFRAGERRHKRINKPEGSGRKFR